MDRSADVNAFHHQTNLYQGQTNPSYRNSLSFTYFNEGANAGPPIYVNDSETVI